MPAVSMSTTKSQQDWFVTYVNHQKIELKMKQTRADKYLLYGRDEDGGDSTTALQVDDNFGTGTKAFQ
jgi:hypothetical protein